MLLLLNHFSCVRICATPQTAAHQAPLSTGFSRQEYWSGLPFPSPMHICMLTSFNRVRLCATPWTAAHQVPLSTGFSRQEYWWVAISFSNAYMHANSLQSCPTLCDPMDSSPPGSSVHRILQARVLVGCHFLLLVYAICP